MNLTEAQKKALLLVPFTPTIAGLIKGVSITTLHKLEKYGFIIKVNRIVKRGNEEIVGECFYRLRT